MEERQMRRLMLTLSLFAALGLMLGIAACKKEQPAAGGDEKKEEVKKDEKKEEPKAEEKKEEKKEEKGGGEKIGVAECDEYLDKYEKCITSKVPEAGRTAMKSGMDQTREAWKKAAATAEGKAALAAGCKTAMEAAKKATAAFNCEW
jgi:hypothetical protein